jgi:hypothetical protein
LPESKIKSGTAGFVATVPCATLRLEVFTHSGFSRPSISLGDLAEGREFPPVFHTETRGMRNNQIGSLDTVASITTGPLLASAESAMDSRSGAVPLISLTSKIPGACSVFQS